jgi:hypothetical protein
MADFSVDSTPRRPANSALMSLIQKMRDRFGIFGELLSFLWAQKLWWIIPMVIVLVLFAFLLIFAGQTGLAPFVYTLF